jgi:hypothetical protein
LKKKNDDLRKRIEILEKKQVLQEVSSESSEDVEEEEKE